MEVKITNITENGTGDHEGVVTGRVGVLDEAPPDQHRATTVRCKSSNISILNQNLGDGKLLNVSKCNHTVCKLCPKLLPTNFFTSTVTHRVYPSKNDNCKSSNVIYLITCSTCNLQYVGETAQQLNFRFAKHRLNMQGQLKGECQKRIKDNFSEGNCKDSNFTVQIIHNLEGNGRTDKKSIDLGVASVRRKIEAEWILRLRTRFPYMV